MPRIIIDRFSLSIAAVVLFMMMVAGIVIPWLFTLNEFNVRSFWAGMTVAFIFCVCAWIINNAFDRMSDAQHWHRKYSDMFDSAQRDRERARAFDNRENQLLHAIEQAQGYITDPNRRRGYKDQAPQVLAEIEKVLNPATRSFAELSLDPNGLLKPAVPNWLAHGLQQNGPIPQVKIPRRSA